MYVAFQEDVSCTRMLLWLTCFINYFPCSTLTVLLIGMISLKLFKEIKMEYEIIIPGNDHYPNT